jgi:hypothetical protein
MVQQKNERWRQLKRITWLTVFAVTASGAMVIALCYGTPLSYFYCLAREKAWLAAKTESELDRRMWAFYSKRPILPSNSMWGDNYVLQPGERMVQYLVFGKEPLDVVLDGESRVVAAFTSYE